jgi:succinate dehydrogenase / fumarate reductase flavoprotein subunit
MIETRPHDVLIIGAGGAGLRAAVACIDAGLSVGVVCKSLLGKAHTVMAEGGMAASLAHVDDRDSWSTHFRDTMVGGYRLNNPRMAELHAKEAPDRVRELEQWGAVFDRTRDGRILQRPFGGHTYPRLAHVGDRTGLELIRTLQDRSVAVGAEVYQEVIITRLSLRGGRVNGAIGYRRTDGVPMAFPAKAVVLATGGIGRSFAVTSNSWESAGDGQALAYRAGAELIDMEFVQFHPTGMVHPAGVKGLLVTEAVRGEGGILRNAAGERFMWRYLPEARRDEYAATDEEARAWVDDLTEGRQTTHRRPPELSTRDNVARAIYTEVKEGRGSPHGGVFLDISYLPAERVRAKLPSMYEQFKELADVDITAGPMEVGPTMHYIMGGIRVDAEVGTTTTLGLYAAGEVAAGLHGSNRLGGNSLTDLLVFGRRAGEAAAVAAGGAAAALTVADAVGAAVAGASAAQAVGAGGASGEELSAEFVAESIAAMYAPFERESGEDPNRLHEDLQATMSSLVGIFRVEADLVRAIGRIEGYKERWQGLRVTGPRRFNPGWDLVFELRNMLTVSEAIARSALERTESRGAHSRLDYVGMRDEWDVVNVAASRDGDVMTVRRTPVVELSAELAGYLTAQSQSGIGRG